MDAATLESYAGKYAEGEMTVSFVAKDGKLTFQQGQGAGATLVSAAKDRFKFLQATGARGAGLNFKFDRDASGAVASVSFNGRGGDMTLKKVVAK